MDESVRVDLRDLRNVDIRQLDETQYRQFQSQINNLPKVKSDLLLIGRAAVGKSTLAETLTNGKIQGSDGPTGGNSRSEDTGFILTESIVNTEGDEIACVHDAVGFDDERYDPEEIMQELKQFHGQFYEDGKSNCTIILCVPWQDRIRSHKLAFEVCDSLKKWDEVIVCVTKCDQISASVRKLPPDKREKKISAKRVQWEESIMRKLESMGVRNFNKKKIVFTCDEQEENLVDPKWYFSLGEALTEAAMATTPEDDGDDVGAFSRFANSFVMGWQFITRFVDRYMYAERNHSNPVVNVNERDEEVQHDIAQVDSDDEEDHLYVPQEIEDNDDERDEVLQHVPQEIHVEVNDERDEEVPQEIEANDDGRDDEMQEIQEVHHVPQEIEVNGRDEEVPQVIEDNDDERDEEAQYVPQEIEVNEDGRDEEVPQVIEDNEDGRDEEVQEKDNERDQEIQHVQQENENLVDPDQDCFQVVKSVVHRHYKSVAIGACVMGVVGGAVEAGAACYTGASALGALAATVGGAAAGAATGGASVAGVLVMWWLCNRFKMYMLKQKKD